MIAAAFALERGGFRLDASFEVPGHGVTAIFGPSGCGKTTLLRCLAGLERAAGGRLVVAGEVWQDARRNLFLPPHRRPLGYVFQEASLFPHLSVRRNLEYGWKRVPKGERRLGFDAVVDLLGLRPLLARDPGTLSGGERQRCAIARALLTSPRVLLMDEPLSALDQASKGEILPYLERLHEELSIPLLLVTHSRDEVARLADHMVLMAAGRVRAAGPLRELLLRFDLPLAAGAEAEVVLEAAVAGHEEGYHLTELEFPGGRLSLPRLPHPIGHRLRARIHARDVSLTLDEPGRSSILNILPAVVLEVSDAGPAQVLVKLGLGEGGATVVLARITRKSADRLALHPGRPVFAQIKSVALVG